MYILSGDRTRELWIASIAIIEVQRDIHFAKRTQPHMIHVLAKAQ